MYKTSNSKHSFEFPVPGCVKFLIRQRQPRDVLLGGFQAAASERGEDHRFCKMEDGYRGDWSRERGGGGGRGGGSWRGRGGVGGGGKGRGGNGRGGGDGGGGRRGGGVLRGQSGSVERGWGSEGFGDDAGHYQRGGGGGDRWGEGRGGRGSRGRGGWEEERSGDRQEWRDPGRGAAAGSPASQARESRFQMHPVGRTSNSSGGLLQPEPAPPAASSSKDENEFLRVSVGIVGTCEEVEKSYVRLTRQPHASSIRPERVLRMSLESVLRREAEGEDYEARMDSLMSICQDLRLQQINNELTVTVRELMAVYALRDRARGKSGKLEVDISSFSDAILHLKTLYEANPGQPRELEFAVYRFAFHLSHPPMHSATSLSRPPLVCHHLHLWPLLAPKP